MEEKNLELFKFTRLYLGQNNWEFLKKITKGELQLFQKFPIDLNKSYIVYGNEELLNKFKAFYLTRCVKKRPLYSQYFILEYASTLSTNTKDEYGLNVDQDLIFLYRHNHMQTLGNSETWLLETILNKVAERNREGLVTVILSEQRMSFLEESKEFEVINLSEVITNKTLKEALETIKADEDNSSEGTLTSIIGEGNTVFESV